MAYEMYGMSESEQILGLGEEFARFELPLCPDSLLLLADWDLLGFRRPILEVVF